jgi:hypothetical protein
VKGYVLTKQDFLNLCAIQAANGTAADAMVFKPQSYETAENSDAQVVPVGAAKRAIEAPGLRGGGLLGIAVFLGVLVLV